LKLYFDTSVFVSLVTNELATPTVIAWFSRQDPGNIVISDWSITEFYSAIALKLRTGQISAELRAGAEQLFTQYTEENFELIPIERSDFRHAAQLAANEKLKLRAGDALHLAKVDVMRFQICSLDAGMLNAARAMGVPAVNPALYQV
jgi:predicted nucleic acid-binding protein